MNKDTLKKAIRECDEFIEMHLKELVNIGYVRLQRFETCCKSLNTVLVLRDRLIEEYTGESK